MTWSSFLVDGSTQRAIAEAIHDLAVSDMTSPDSLALTAVRFLHASVGSSETATQVQFLVIKKTSRGATRARATASMDSVVSAMSDLSKLQVKFSLVVALVGKALTRIVAPPRGKLGGAYYVNVAPSAPAPGQGASDPPTTTAQPDASSDDVDELAVGAGVVLGILLLVAAVAAVVIARTGRFGDKLQDTLTFGSVGYGKGASIDDVVLQGMHTGPSNSCNA